MENTMDHRINVSIGNLQRVLLDLFEITHAKQKREKTPEIYRKLIAEEFNEFMAEPHDTPENFKELCDLIWVCIQYANACKYELEYGLDELVQEYMSKLYDKEGRFCPTYREDGKLLKGDNFKKADFKALMERVRV